VGPIAGVLLLAVTAAATGAPMKARRLGPIREFEETVRVPREGLRLVFRANPDRAAHRTVVRVTASERGARATPSVRLVLDGRDAPGATSSLRCLEQDYAEPRPASCTIHVVTGWKGAKPHDLSLTIEPASPAESPTVDVGISIFDPLER
jgi:hypothetical protein